MSRETRLNVPLSELYYYDEDTGTSKPLTKDGAIPVVVVGGAVGGGSTMNFLNGNGEPSNEVGDNGDVYLNADNGDLYKKEDSSWSVIANLKGLKGEQGEQGVAGKDGVDGKDGKDGADGFPTQGDWEEVLSRLSLIERRISNIGGGGDGEVNHT